MFNVIRIPTKFSKSIRRLNQKEKAELLDILMNIGDGIQSIPPNSQMGDIIELIYGEWMNMESRNGTKPKKSLIEAYSEGVGTEDPSESEHRVEYNRVEESIVEYSIVDNEISKEISHTQNNGDISTSLNKNHILEKYNISMEELEEEIQLFKKYWTAPIQNGKNKGKELWTTKDTFVPSLRFATWLANNKKWTQRNLYNKPSGIGYLD